jgi:hypothetical protein
MRKYVTACLMAIVFASSPTNSQTGGSHTYDFLNLTNSARVASLGGKNISLYDNDLNLAYHNPSLLSPEQNGNFAVNYISYFAAVNYGYAAFAKDVQNTGTFAIGLHYVDYGQFETADRFGNLTGGRFYGADYALNLMFARAIDSTFRWGVTIKPIYSKLEHYNSFGIAADLGITGVFDEGLLTTAFVLKNMGFQISSYTGDYREPLPFEIQLGISKKFQFAPFRLSFTAHSLQKYNMLYDDQNTNTSTATDIAEEEPSKSSKFADNFFRHMIVGLEFLPTKSFYLAISYDHKKRKEMALADYGNYVGFSYGFGLRLKKFSLAYGYSVLHAAGGSNHFSFTLNLSQLYSK